MGLNRSEAHHPPFGLLIGHSKPEASQNPDAYQVEQKDPSNPEPLYITH